MARCLRGVRIVLGIAYRQLRFDKGRSVVTSVGIAAVFAVILVLQGFQQGLYAQLRNVSTDRGADLVATQAGVRNMVAARSVIPQMARGQVEAVDGVKVAHPMTALPLIYEKDGHKSAIFLAVFDKAGGPQQIVEGRAVSGSGEAVIDRSLAEIHGLSLGQKLTVAGYSFEIVGITKDAAAMFTPFVFTNFDALIDFYFETKLAEDMSAFPLLSYLLLELEAGANLEAVKQNVETAVPDVDVLETSVLADNDEQLGKTMFGAILGILIGVGYVAGVVVVGLFMFSTAEGRRRDLGVLKALGFSNRALTSVIVLETVLLTALAVPLGVVIAHGISAAVHHAMPTYLILPTVPGPLLRSIAACAVFALMGALAPLRFVRRLEPVEVFRS